MEMKQLMRKYFWALFGAIGMIAFWAGIWEGVGYLPYLENPWISLVIGLTMLISSGYLFKEFDPIEEMEVAATKVLHMVKKHPSKHEFSITYSDKISGKRHNISGSSLKDIEKNVLVLAKKGEKEIFVPLHRITEVFRKNKSFWKAEAAK